MDPARMFKESLTSRPELENAIMRRARPYRGENHGPGKDVQGELDLTPGIREQPGSNGEVAAGLCHFRSGHCPSVLVMSEKGYANSAPKEHSSASTGRAKRRRQVF